MTAEWHSSVWLYALMMMMYDCTVWLCCVTPVYNGAVWLQNGQAVCDCMLWWWCMTVQCDCCMTAQYNGAIWLQNDQAVCDCMLWWWRCMAVHGVTAVWLHCIMVLCDSKMTKLCVTVCSDDEDVWLCTVWLCCMTAVYNGAAEWLSSVTVCSDDEDVWLCAV